jgi:serine/threonine protein kinase
MNVIPRKLGRYIIIREIGRGAMGVVYKAHDPVIEREVAIKAIQISFDVNPEERNVFLHRFYREAKAAGKLSHPNIVTIFDVDEDKETGTPFIVMEFLEGTTISEVASSGILLPLEDVNNVILQLADALNYAHNEGVVHRDIKAANILVLPGMRVKIMDFGIARLPSSDLTQSGQFIGTPNYMSPEQIEGITQVDGRSDLFSLGVIFYMLLTGERPFTGDSFNTVSYRIVNVEHAPPRTLNPNVPKVYNAILTKLLAKNPEERYQTGAELAADVKKLVANFGEIEELREMDLDSTTGTELPLPSSPQIKKKETPSSSTSTIWGTENKKRVITFGLLIGLVFALTFGSIYYIRTTSAKKQVVIVPRDVVTKPDAVAELSRQNSIRIKWDLAVKYLETGAYDNSIKELNDILVLSPSNPDAKKLLDLVEGKRALEQKKKFQPAPPPPAVVQSRRPLVAIKPKPSPVLPVTLQPAPPVKTASVEFEFEHGFPSGSFYIFTNDKLAFEGNLSGEKKKVLIFQNYKGKLSGSLNVPLGKINFLVHVVCRERGVSASKRVTVNITETGPHNLRIKYLKSPKQLELKWT